MRRCTAPLLLVVLLAQAAHAGDGRLEINQASALAGGVIPGDGAGFPVTISASGSYVLTGNLTVSSENDTAINVTVGDVTIDLNGFTIAGPVVCSDGGAGLACAPAGSGFGIAASLADRVTVRNGQVTGFGSYGVLLGDQCRVVDVVASHNGADGITGGTGCVIRRNVVTTNGGDGVDVSHNSVVVENVASGNGGDGLSADEGGVLRLNSSSENEANGIAGYFGVNSVHSNTVFGNGDNGIRASAAASVTNNTIRNNGNLGLFLNVTAGYTQNVITTPGGAGTPVSGGVSMGGNLCDGAGC